MTSASLQIEHRGAVQLVGFNVSDLTSDVVDLLRPAMLALSEPFDLKIVLDLSGVRFLGSAALGLIIQTAIRASKRRGKVVLAAPHPDVYEVLTGPPRMMRDIPVFSDRDQAARSLES